MTIAVQSLLEAFDGLSDPERQEAAVEILRRVTPQEGELSEGGAGGGRGRAIPLA